MRRVRYLAIDHRADAEYLQWLLLMPAPLELRVLPVNTGAQRLYEQLGFAVTHTEDEFVYMRHAAGAAAP